MINLLPPDIKEDYRYARLNRRIVQWAVAFMLGIVGVLMITAFGLYAMNHSANNFRAQNTMSKEQLARQNVTGVQKQVTEISNNLKLMVTVLSKEVLFSKLLARLGAITPSSVILTNLSISQTESAIDITAKTASYNAATQLQVNLADPNNQIFSKADIVSINCPTGAATTDPNYPCTVNIRALFTKNNPFLFINSTAGKVAH